LFGGRYRLLKSFREHPSIEKLVKKKILLMRHKAALVADLKIIVSAR
jgi:hypothetical protein